MVDGLEGFKYPKRLKILNLHSMELIQSDLILAFNMHHHRVDLPLNEFFDPPAASNLRGHEFKTRPRIPHRQRRQHAFSVRVANPWNMLPRAVVEQPSLSKFKEFLDDHHDATFAERPT